MDVFNAYRKLFASTTNEEVCWWYCGTIASDIVGFGQMPIGQAETLMIYKTESPAPDTLRIFWREIGYFRDPATGEIARSWFNPLTGKDEVRQTSFEDGPAEFTVTKKGESVEITLQQSNARIEGVRLESAVANGQVSLMQYEDKTRANQRPDGTRPDMNSPDAVQVQTILSIYGGLDDVLNPGVANVRASGFYSCKQTSKSLAGKSATDLWSRAFVTGVMRKAAPDEILNPIAWHRMKSLYPLFFKDERVSPNWT